MKNDTNCPNEEFSIPYGAICGCSEKCKHDECPYDCDACEDEAQPY